MDFSFHSTFLLHPPPPAAPAVLADLAAALAPFDAHLTYGNSGDRTQLAITLDCTITSEETDRFFRLWQTLLTRYADPESPVSCTAEPPAAVRSPCHTWTVLTPLARATAAHRALLQLAFRLAQQVQASRIALDQLATNPSARQFTCTIAEEGTHPDPSSPTPPHDGPDTFRTLATLSGTIFPSAQRSPA